MKTLKLMTRHNENPPVKMRNYECDHYIVTITPMSTPLGEREKKKRESADMSLRYHQFIVMEEGYDGN